MSPRALNVGHLNAVHETLGRQSVNPSFHAFCHLTTNPDCPQQLLAMSKDQLLKLNAQCHQALSMWLTRRTRDNATGADSVPDSNDSPHPPRLETHNLLPSATEATPRSKKNVAGALLRDGRSSVISRFGIFVEVAHIFSYSLGRQKDAPDNRKLDFYQVFELFFGCDCAASLRAYILGDPDDPQTNINRLENLITLTRDEHASFGMGLIVLEPVPGCLAPDNSSYSAIFRKIPVSTHAANQAHIPITLLPNLVHENEDPDLRHVFLHNFHSRAEISSGQVIQLTTDDPITRPLPDPTLLSLHAAISQIVRMAGRAGIPEWEYEDEQDEQEPQHNSCTTSLSTPNTHLKEPKSQTPPAMPLSPPKPAETLPPQTYSSRPCTTTNHPPSKATTRPFRRLWTAIKTTTLPKIKAIPSRAAARKATTAVRRRQSRVAGANPSESAI